MLFLKSFIPTMSDLRLGAILITCVSLAVALILILSLGASCFSGSSHAQTQQAPTELWSATMTVDEFDQGTGYSEWYRSQWSSGGSITSNGPVTFPGGAALTLAELHIITENKDRPFVLYVSTFEPHSPYHGPFMDMYDPATLPVGPAFLRKPEPASLVNRVRANYFLQFMLDEVDQFQDDYMMRHAAAREDVTTETGWRTLRAHYMANITLVDRMVGKITAALDRAGVADNTVVVFTANTVT